MYYTVYLLYHKYTYVLYIFYLPPAGFEFGEYIILLSLVFNPVTPLDI